MAACSTRSLTRCRPAEASASAAAASWVWPARSAFLAALSAPRTSCTATAEPAWSAQTTSVTGHSASPGRALRAPTTAEPISSAQMAAATAATGRAERGRRGAACTARLASSTDGDSGNRWEPRCSCQATNRPGSASSDRGSVGCRPDRLAAASASSSASSTATATRSIGGAGRRRDGRRNWKAPIRSAAPPAFRRQPPTRATWSGHGVAPPEPLLR